MSKRVLHNDTEEPITIEPGESVEVFGEKTRSRTSASRQTDFTIMGTDIDEYHERLGNPPDPGEIDQPEEPEPPNGYSGDSNG